MRRNLRNLVLAVLLGTLAASGPLKKAAGQAPPDANRLSAARFRTRRIHLRNGPIPAMPCLDDRAVEGRHRGEGRTRGRLVWREGGGRSERRHLAGPAGGWQMVGPGRSRRRRASGRPALAVLESGVVPAQGRSLVVVQQSGPNVPSWWGELRTSNDGGQTWSKGEHLPEGFLGPIRNKPVQLASGELLCPSSTETLERDSRWRVVFERTPDLGALGARSRRQRRPEVT